MRKKVLTVLEIFFILVFIFSVAQIIRIVNNYKKGDAIYETAKTYVEDTHEKDGDKEEYYFTIDLKSLKEINPEVMGWIRIPDTPIDYPLLQGTDNKYYLKHTYDNQYSDFGSTLTTVRPKRARSMVVLAPISTSLPMTTIPV